MSFPPLDAGRNQRNLDTFVSAVCGPAPAGADRKHRLASAVSGFHGLSLASPAAQQACVRHRTGILLFAAPLGGGQPISPSAVRAFEAAWEWLESTQPAICPTVAELLVAAVLSIEPEGAFLGSTGRAIGVIFVDGTLPAAALAREIMHEVIHTAISLEDAVHGLFADQNVQALSCIRGCARPYRLACHAALVHAGLGMLEMAASADTRSEECEISQLRAYFAELCVKAKLAMTAAGRQYLQAVADWVLGPDACLPAPPAAPVMVTPPGFLDPIALVLTDGSATAGVAHQWPEPMQRYARWHRDHPEESHLQWGWGPSEVKFSWESSPTSTNVSNILDDSLYWHKVKKSIVQQTAAEHDVNPGELAVYAPEFYHWQVLHRKTVPVLNHAAVVAFLASAGLRFNLPVAVAQTILLEMAQPVECCSWLLRSELHVLARKELGRLFGYSEFRSIRASVWDGSGALIEQRFGGMRLLESDMVLVLSYVGPDGIVDDAHGNELPAHVDALLRKVLAVGVHNEWNAQLMIGHVKSGKYSWDHYAAQLTKLLEDHDFDSLYASYQQCRRKPGHDWL